MTRICRAIDKSEKIGILGDYDVDGATSTSLFLKYFEALGIDVIYHIPDRITEGYGPSRQGIDFLPLKMFLL
ncbi:MAG: hypothetical protein H6925_06000 [Holosporaceae bacterium]|nr:MAG: hypothetical protein H6925_06000 [Holosporaceae bacterium]